MFYYFLGAGQLTVRIRGPKGNFFLIFNFFCILVLLKYKIIGAFRVDMQRKDDKDRQIMCKYDPLEVSLT